MKKIKNLPESDFLKLFYLFLSTVFLIGAVCMPDRGEMFSGLWKICSQPGKISTNDFFVGGYAGTFLNVALVGYFFTALFYILKAPANNVSTLGFILTLGFCSWGITILNILPTVLGVALFCLVRKESLSANINATLFSTGIAPLINDLLIRYPNSEVAGFNLPGALIALAVGLAIGFFLPAGLAHAPNVHKGFDLYSAAVPVCFFAFFLNALLYKTMGVALPAAPDTETLQVASRMTVNVFCLTLFGSCVVLALLLGCRWKDYKALLLSKEHVGSVSGKLGNPVFLMNFGLFGAFILAYYNLIGASFNGVTFGIIFCMLATCNSGSHPKNVTPILLGYVAASFLFAWLSKLVGGTFATAINAQAIVVGVCYANGMSPVVSKYGWFWGFLAAVMHYVLVTSVPNLHGGFCLYNGGFTAAIICLLLVPELERFQARTVDQR